MYSSSKIDRVVFFVITVVYRTESSERDWSREVAGISNDTGASYTAGGVNPYLCDMEVSVVDDNVPLHKGWEKRSAKGKV